jgi:hypothetical protein
MTPARVGNSIAFHLETRGIGLAGLLARPDII